MNYEKRFKAAYLELQQVCHEAAWGDPFSYARAKEMFMAIELGHSIADTLSGADAYNQHGEPVEYKSTIGKSISGTYNGISVLPTEGEQEEYLRNKKLGCYPDHYIARFGRESGVIEEMYHLTGEQVCEMYHRVYGMSTVTARFFNVYGKRQPTRGVYATVVGIFEGLSKEGEPLTITGDGDQRRDFTHISDIVRGFAVLGEAKWQGQIFNLGCGKNYSINELANMFGGEKKYVPARPGEARNTLAVHTEMTKATGWTPSVSLKRYVNSWKDENV